MIAKFSILVSTIGDSTIWQFIHLGLFELNELDVERLHAVSFFVTEFVRFENKTTEAMLVHIPVFYMALTNALANLEGRPGNSEKKHQIVLILSQFKINLWEKSEFHGIADVMKQFITEEYLRVLVKLEKAKINPFTVACQNICEVVVSLVQHGSYKVETWRLLVDILTSFLKCKKCRGLSEAITGVLGKDGSDFDLFQGCTRIVLAGKFCDPNVRFMIIRKAWLFLDQVSYTASSLRVIEEIVCECGIGIVEQDIWRIATIGNKSSNMAIFTKLWRYFSSSECTYKSQFPFFSIALYAMDGLVGNNPRARIDSEDWARVSLTSYQPIIEPIIERIFSHADISIGQLQKCVHQKSFVIFVHLQGFNAAQVDYAFEFLLEMIQLDPKLFISSLAEIKHANYSILDWYMETGEIEPIESFLMICLTYYLLDRRFFQAEPQDTEFPREFDLNLNLSIQSRALSMISIVILSVHLSLPMATYIYQALEFKLASLLVSEQIGLQPHILNTLNIIAARFKLIATFEFTQWTTVSSHRFLKLIKLAITLTSNRACISHWTIFLQSHLKIIDATLVCSLETLKILSKQLMTDIKEFNCRVYVQKALHTIIDFIMIQKPTQKSIEHTWLVYDKKEPHVENSLLINSIPSIIKVQLSILIPHELKQTCQWGFKILENIYRVYPSLALESICTTNDYKSIYGILKEIGVKVPGNICSILRSRNGSHSSTEIASSYALVKVLHESIMDHCGHSVDFPTLFGFAQAQITWKQGANKHMYQAFVLLLESCFKLRLFVGDAKIQKDAEELFLACADGLVLTIARGFDMGVWKRMGSDTHSLLPPTLGNRAEDLQYGILEPSYKSEINEEGVITWTLDYMAEYLIPFLKIHLSGDKSTALLTNFHGLVGNTCLRKTNYIKYTSKVFLIMQQIDQQLGHGKIWRSDVLAFFNDSKFFYAFNKHEVSPLLSLAINMDPSFFTDALLKVLNKSSIFAESIDTIRLSIRRLSFMIYSCPQNKFIKILPSIHEKITEILKTCNPQLSTECICLISVLFLRIDGDDRHLHDKFMAIIIHEAVTVFTGYVSSPTPETCLLYSTTVLCMLLGYLKSDIWQYYRNLVMRHLDEAVSVLKSLDLPKPVNHGVLWVYSGNGDLNALIRDMFEMGFN